MPTVIGTHISAPHATTGKASNKILIAFVPRFLILAVIGNPAHGPPERLRAYGLRTVS
jgi:hypothetical protein